MIAPYIIGLIYGDIVDDPSAKMIMTQILVGAIPGVGTAADARDVLAGMYKIWTTGGDEGKVQTLMAMVGLIPLMGDGIKAARSARAARKSAGEAFADAARSGLHEASESLARKAIKDPDAIAKKMDMSKKELSAEVKELSGLTKKLESGKKAGAKKYAKKMTKYFNETGDAAFVVRMGGGKWSKVAKALQASSEGRALGEMMERWRNVKLSALKKEVKKRTAHLGSEGSPEMIRTGTGGFLSDADLSFMGPSSTLHKNVAREVMEEMFGRHWKILLDADIFADPKRLFLFEEVLPGIGGKEARAIERRLATESELNVLGKMWLYHSDPGTVGKMAKKLGVDMDDVYRRAKEIGHMTKENIAKLELDMDVLHRRFLETKNAAEKARIAEEMAVSQGKLNAAVEGPYMTPGGAMKHVGRRELALRPKGPFAAMSPMMAYTAVLDDYYMLHRVFDDISHAGGEFTEKTAKSMAKYAERLMITAGHLGAIDVTARVSHELFNTIATLLKRSRSLDDLSALTAAKAHLEAAKVLMTKTIDDMSPALKKSLETYLASAPHAAKGSKSGKAFIALAIVLLNREKDSWDGYLHCGWRPRV